MVALSLLLSACQGIAEGSGGSANNVSKQTSEAPTPTTPPATPAVLDVFPADLATAVAPNAPVTVKASSGVLGAVSLADAKGQTVGGQAGPDGVWTSSELLRPSTVYTLTMASTGPDGTATTTSSTFTTLTPKVTATYGLIPNGGVVGVGMPVIVQFDTGVITKAQRAEVEKRVKVTTLPVQQGAWGWLDNRQLMWRPKDYWFPGTKVTVSTPLHGLQTGADKWIAGDDQASFTVGSSMVSTVDIRAHTLVARRDGVVLRTIPVSTGRPGPLTETRSGTKVIIERNSVIVMDSATVGIPKGDPNYYKVTTKWNLRVTWTGEFIHSAPWSVDAQGTTNVSHGCTNMSPANAEWMFNNSKMGDIVKFTG
ncbi:MAG: L,D-transpeptidase family protein, partial [Actinobacteria bacterium]|nr:L,D-transpeptidase family protein [Actinomycetota bacterium]